MEHYERTLSSNFDSDTWKSVRCQSCLPQSLRETSSSGYQIAEEVEIMAHMESTPESLENAQEQRSNHNSKVHERLQSGQKIREVLHKVSLN